MLKVEAVGATYGKGQVLWDVTFDMDNERNGLAILGRNGVGKTTLLRTIMGLHPTAKGHIFFNGTDITSMSAHKRAGIGISYVPQGRGIFPHLSVEENLKMGMVIDNNNRGMSMEGVFELFPKLGVLLKRPGGNLSGGEQQQLAIARALLSRPRLLLLDEPTEGIQPSIVSDIEYALYRIRKELNIAVILVEQHIDFAWRFADSYCVIQKGSVIAHGNTAGVDPATVDHLLGI